MYAVVDESGNAPLYPKKYAVIPRFESTPRSGGMLWALRKNNGMAQKEIAKNWVLLRRP